MTIQTSTSTRPRRGESPAGNALGKAAVAYLVVAAALATASSYLIQPELRPVARDLGVSVSAITVAAGSAIVGYLVGLAVLVPLVDHVRANRLVAAQLAGLATGLSVAACAPNPALLGAGLFVAGAGGSTGAQLSTLAGKHSAPGRRGQAVGRVTAGISAGILLGRIVGGALADWLGWRVMLGVLGGVCLTMAAGALRALPTERVKPTQRYGEVLRSLPKLVRSTRRLRVAAAAGSLWFLAFSLVWVGLSLALSQAPLHRSSTQVGLYSLAGLVGIAGTRVGGRLADRHGSRRVVVGGLALACASTLVLAFALQQTIVVLLALALFDAGLFAAQVANQSQVLGIDPERPARFNSAYMVIFFVGGSVGTATGGAVVDGLGWPALAGIAGGAVLLAALVRWSSPE
ncbi:MAG: MFS transporter [Catenulispora sp.]